MTIINKLVVRRRTGERKCVLTGLAGEIVTTKTPQLMCDYLNAEYPGETVRWMLMPPKEKLEAA